MDRKNIIETKNISFSYDGKAWALENVSLEIPAGKKTVFLGPNGSGKSTLFLHFNGVNKPDKGEIFYDGRKIFYSQKELSKLRSEVGIVFQNPDDQIFSATVEEDVAFGPMNMGVTREEIEKRVDEALSLVEMESSREKPTSQLSFGQRKRVALAGALAMKPKVLVMDEPTAGLDPEMVHELLELSDELNHKGVTVVLSTHDVETAYEWADEIKVLRGGKLEYSGKPEGFFARGDIHEFGLAPPLAFMLNEEMHKREGRKKSPEPKSFAELVAKSFPLAGKKGGELMLVCLTKEALSLPAKKKTEGKAHKHTGIYGALARKLAKMGKLDAHHQFHALEHGLLCASGGEDFTLYIDASLCPIVEERAKRLEERAGIKIKILHEHPAKEKKEADKNG